MTQNKTPPLAEKLANAGGVTITLTAGLMVCLSSQVATAYAAAADPAAQMKILRQALADGAAVPLSSAGARVAQVQLAGYNDTHPPGMGAVWTPPAQLPKEWTAGAPLKAVPSIKEKLTHQPSAWRDMLREGLEAGWLEPQTGVWPPPPSTPSVAYTDVYRRRELAKMNAPTSPDVWVPMPPDTAIEYAKAGDLPSRMKILENFLTGNKAILDAALIPNWDGMLQPQRQR